MCHKSKNITIGRYNCLEVVRHKDQGIYLSSMDGTQLLMPKRYVTSQMKEGSLVEAFVYTDSEDRLVATTDEPLAQLGEFAYLECVDVTDFGAFIYWGMPKDLLVPKNAQETPMQKGQKYIVRISLDNQTHRLVGVSKLKPFMSSDTKNITKNEKYPAIVHSKTPMGYKLIVNHQYSGMLFNDEIFTDIHEGDSVEVYIKTIRLDGKLDCSLQPIGEDANSFAKNKILHKLQAKKQLPFTSKSAPQLIQSEFGLSKKSFKRTLQLLKEEGLIEIKEQGIYLIDK